MKKPSHWSALYTEGDSKGKKNWKLKKLVALIWLRVTIHGLWLPLFIFLSINLSLSFRHKLFSLFLDSHALTFSLYPFNAHSMSLSPSTSLSLSHSFCHSFYASPSLKRPFVLSLSLARSLTLSLACLHTHSLTLCLFLSRSFSLLPLLLVYNLSLDSSFSHKTQTHTIFYKNICKQAHMVQCYVFFRPMRLTNFIGGIFTVWRAGL